MAQPSLIPAFSAPAQATGGEDIWFIPNAMERGLHSAIQRFAAASLALPEGAQAYVVSDPYATIAEREEAIDALQPEEAQGRFGHMASRITETASSHVPEIATLTAGGILLGPWG